MQLTLLCLLTATFFTRTLSADEFATTSIPTTETIVKLSKISHCGQVQNTNSDCTLPKTNELPLPTSELANDTQLRNHQETTTLFYTKSKSNVRPCDNPKVALQNEVNNEDSSTETIISDQKMNDLQAEETLQAFSVALPPSEIIINLDKTDKMPSKPKINQALFSLNTAQRFTAIRTPPPIQNPLSTEIEVMKSIEIPFNNSQFQISISAENLPMPDNSDQIQEIFEHTRPSRMENILQRRERYEVNRHDRRPYLNGNPLRVGSYTGQPKVTNNMNNIFTSENRFQDYLDFNSRMLIANNIVREDTTFGEKHARPAEISVGQDSLKEKNSEPYITLSGTPFQKSSVASMNIQEIDNISTVPKPPTRMTRRRNKNTIYNTSNARNFYRSKFRKNSTSSESNAKDDNQYHHSIRIPNPISVSTTTEIYTRSTSRESKSRVRKLNADFATRNESMSQGESSTVRTYPKRSQRRRISTTTETPPTSASTASSDLHTEKKLSLPPIQQSRIQAVAHEACAECPNVQSLQDTSPSRNPSQKSLDSTQVITRSRGSRKYNPRQEPFRTEVPVSTRNNIQTWKTHRTPEQQQEKQQERHNQQWQEQERQNHQFQEPKRQNQQSQEKEQHEQQQLQQQWTQQYYSKPHNLEVFTQTHLAKIDTPVDAFTSIHLAEAGKINRGLSQYHEPVNTGHFLRVFHPAEGSTSFTHHGSTPTVDQRGPVEDILLVGYQHDAAVTPVTFRPSYQQQGNSFFF